jgi:DNA-binding response OmpR family regulator
MLKQIVIIEDNLELIKFIENFLKTSGDFQVKGYPTGSEALKSLKLNKPDLVLIDLELTDLRGETICVELRKDYPDLPIIILTGDKSQSSIVTCLNSGADDYVTKPFNADVLLARINARLRNVDSVPNNQVLTLGDLSVNLETLEVKRDSKLIELTAKEFELLKYLVMNKSRILTRDKILNAVWGYNTIVDTRVVDVHIGKLRKKIEDGFKTKLVETVRGFGYKVSE